MTSDIGLRLKQHKEGSSLYTKKFSDINLMYQEQHETKKLAKEREKQLKGWSVAKKKALIEGKLELLTKLCRSI
mgnify:FL=1